MKKVRQIACTEDGWKAFNNHMKSNRGLKKSYWMEKAIMNQIKADQDEK